MKRISYFAICVLLLSATGVFGGEVIDGVVATVNHMPIFQSDWDEAILFETFMQQKPLRQVTEADKVSALQRLIDRELIAAEMGDPHYLQPSPEELQKETARLKAQLAADTQMSWPMLLASYGLTEQVLQEHLRTQVQVMNFIEVRLRPHVKIQPEEVKAYYQNQMLTEPRTGAAVKAVSFDEAEPAIRELLTQQRMDQLLDAWLHNLRQQARIETAVPIPAVDAAAEPVRGSGSD